MNEMPGYMPDNEHISSPENETNLTAERALEGARQLSLIETPAMMEAYRAQDANEYHRLGQEAIDQANADPRQRVKQSLALSVAVVSLSPDLEASIQDLADEVWQMNDDALYQDFISALDLAN